MAIELQERREAAAGQRRHLLDLQHLDDREFHWILDRAAEYARGSRRPDPKSLLGRRVLLLFYEPSTRTRVSFEMAARRLGADVVFMQPAGSSAQKGESLRDTAENLVALGAEAIVIRHGAGGAAAFLARHVGEAASVINAGDGIHEHPTQGLLDLLTIRLAKGRVAGLKVAIIGDLLHSRVARSAAWALQRLGAEVWFAGPGSLGGEELAALGVRVASLAEALSEADVVMTLRIQKERLAGAGLPGAGEYRRFWSITRERLALARPDALLMHPGPVNRGVELPSEVVDGPAAVILDQVRNGVAVRMAVLELLLEGGNL